MVNLWLEKLTRWSRDNQDRLYHFQCFLTAMMGLLLITLAYFMGGNTHFPLILDGVRTQGRIVDFQEHVSRSRKGASPTAYMPIVEFKIGNKVVRFSDWLGSETNSLPDGDVPVIYDAANPTVAMIDRPIGNWMPWSPIFIVGLFGVLLGIKNWIKRDV